MKWTALIVTFTALYSLAGCGDIKKKTAAQPAPPPRIPAAQPARPAPTAQPVRTNFVKAPIDRARSVFEKVQKQNKEGGL